MKVGSGFTLLAGALLFGSLALPSAPVHADGGEGQGQGDGGQQSKGQPGEGQQQQGNGGDSGHGGKTNCQVSACRAPEVPVAAVYPVMGGMALTGYVLYARRRRTAEMTATSAVA